MGEYKLINKLLFGERNAVISNEIGDIAYNAIVTGKAQMTAEQINMFGTSYSLGRCNLRIDDDRASELWFIASEMGNATACYNLAYNIKYRKGFNFYRKQYGTANTEARMIALFTVAAELGYNQAKREIGIWHEKNGHSEEALKWFKDATVEPYPDAYSCIKVVEHISKTEGKEVYGGVYYHDETTKKQSELMLNAIRCYAREAREDQPKDIRIPFNVLKEWHSKITYEMPKLERKNLELELRPPEVGGILYEAAKSDFEKLL